MFPGGPNPTKLQSAPNSRLAPLVLIHDGGGTTFSYFFLGNLNRTVWAIHNPNYWKGEKWEGGIDAMAKNYITLIRNAGIRGKIILGGWSLGGYLAVAISRLIADDPTALFSVHGIMMIDSPYHVPYKDLDEPIMDPVLTDVPKLIQTCFSHCDDYLEEWALPSWNTPTKNGKKISVAVASKPYNLERNQVLRQGLDGQWAVYETKETYNFGDETPEKAIAPPPGALIKCTNWCEAPAGKEGTCTIDKFRRETLLGWEARYPEFIKMLMEVEATHFDVFDKDQDKRLEDVTDKIKKALGMFDLLIRLG